MRLPDAVDWYWTAKVDLSPATRRDYALTFRRLVEFVGQDKQIEQMTAIDLQRFLSHLRDTLVGRRKGPVSKKTLCNAWVALSSLWEWAHKQIGIAHVVREHVPCPRYFRPEIEPFSVADVEAMLKACESYEQDNRLAGQRMQVALPVLLVVRNRAIIRTLLDTGMRREELVKLRVEDYNRRTGHVAIRHGKGDKARTVYLGKRTMKSLAEYLMMRKKLEPQMPLFHSESGDDEGRFMLGSSLQKLIARLGKRAHVDRAFPHRFRHTFAVLFLRSGGSELALQRLLGHESLETVLIYARLAQTDVENQHKLASPVDRFRV